MRGLCVTPYAWPMRNTKNFRAHIETKVERKKIKIVERVNPYA